MTATPNTGAARPSASDTCADRAPLEELARIATELGSDSLGASIAELDERVGEGRFYLACLGKFKRGKSTLLNALVGQPILPMGVVPVTTVPTIVRYGGAPEVHIHFVNGESANVSIGDLEAYVSESRNPRNVLRVEAVEVLFPSTLLRDGLCLVDTAGLGSAFHESTAATHAFVPQIDAALIVIGADPPISGDELRLITDVAQHTSHMIVVLNKADRFTDAERREARQYSERVLTEALGRTTGPVFEVSAAERVAGSGSTRDWASLTATIEALTVDSGKALVRSALDRGVIRLIQRCLREIGEANAALFRPLDESERRMENLQIQVGHLAHESLLLGFRMEHAAEELGRGAANRRREFLLRNLPAARSELERALGEIRGGTRPARRGCALLAARAIAERKLTPWLAEERRSAEVEYQELTERFTAHARSFLSKSPELSALDVGDMSGEVGPAESIRVASSLAGDCLPPRAPTPLTTWRAILLALAPPRTARAMIERDSVCYLEMELTRGARLVADDLDARIARSAERLKQEVRAALKEAYDAADRGIARARRARSQGEEVYRREMERTTRLRHATLALLEAARYRGRQSSTRDPVAPPER